MTVTVSVESADPLATVSENVSSVRVVTTGAVNAGVAVVALSSVTVGPAVCVHA